MLDALEWRIKEGDPVLEKDDRSSFGQIEFVLLEECDQGEEKQQAIQCMSLGFKGGQSQRCRFSH